jgi:hypothetical protein
MSTLCGEIFITVLLAIIFIHAVWPMINDSNFQFGRFFYSYIILLMMCIGALGFTVRLISAPTADISRWVNHALWFLVLNAIISLCGFKLFPYSTYKPVGIFSEPSHFALILAPLLAFACGTKARNYRLALIFFFVWGLVIENLTTLVAVILSLLITVRFAISKNAFITIIVISVFTAVSVQVIDTDYFLSRLEISNESNNLSVLVLLQGWETSVEMIKMTGAWGVGFQQFGFIDVSGEIIEKIANLGEEGLNKLDGGSMAAKITGEFGVLGLAAIFMIVIQAFRAYLRLKSAKLNDCSGGQILLSASLFTYVIELFARGVGYFSPTGFLVLCALINVYCYEKRSRS